MARDFDGTDDKLDVAAVPVSASPITLAAWFESDSATAVQVLVAIGDTATNDEELALVASGDLAGDPIVLSDRSGAGTTTVASTTGYTVGRWHHACGIKRNANDRSAYIDGGSRGNDVSNQPDASGLDTIRIGVRARLTQSLWFNGRIAEVAIWNVALNDEEISQLAGGALPKDVRPESLVGYWALCGRQSPEPDTSRNTNHMVITGAAQANHPGHLARSCLRSRGLLGVGV